jgi:hypothetical protein
VPGAFLLAAGIPLMGFCLWWLSRSRSGAALVGALIVAMVLLLALTALAMYLPLHDMIESLRAAPQP